MQEQFWKRSIWIIPFMPWIPPPLICASRFLVGQIPGNTKAAVKLHTLFWYSLSGAVLYPHNGWIVPRCECIRHSGLRKRSFLHHGQRLPGLDSAKLYSSPGSLLCNTGKENLAFERIYSNTVDKTTGLRCDQTIRLKNYYASLDYPDKLRRIKYYDKEHDKTFVFLDQ